MVLVTGSLTSMGGFCGGDSGGMEVGMLLVGFHFRLQLESVNQIDIVQR